MNRATIIALMVSLVYCLSSSYVLYSISTGSLWTPPGVMDNLLFPGYILGFIGGYVGSLFFSVLGQIITFLILFFLLRSFFKWIAYEFQKLKNNSSDSIISIRKIPFWYYEE